MRFMSNVIAIMAVIGLGFTTIASAHCQIPCGIYDDELRVKLIEEHITTLEKSMNQIHKLAGDKSALSSNQAARWVMNKELHAQEIQDIVTDYFMAQRIKNPGSKKGEAYATYLNRLSLLHGIQVAAMKAKQSPDREHINTLRDLVAAFRTAYFGDKLGHKH